MPCPEQVQRTGSRTRRGREGADVQFSVGTAGIAGTVSWPVPPQVPGCPRNPGASTWSRGGRQGGVPGLQRVLVQGHGRVRRGGRGWGWHEVGQRQPLREGLQAHAVKVPRSQQARLTAAQVQRGPQRAIGGRLEHAGGAHARWQPERAHQLLGAGVGGQPQSGNAQQESGFGGRAHPSQLSPQHPPPPRLPHQQPHRYSRRSSLA